MVEKIEFEVLMIGHGHGSQRKSVGILLPIILALAMDGSGKV